MKPVLVIITLWLTGLSGAWAHGGEDHGAPPPAVNQTVHPRAVATSDEFEMVAVLENKTLSIYLDRLADNAPVTGAKVEVEGGGLKGVAAESAPGVYGLKATTLTAAKHPLTIAVETPDSADLLSASLDLSAPPTEPVPPHTRSDWVVGSGAASLAVAGGLLWRMRRKKSSRGPK